MSRFTESDVEEAALEWFEELQYQILSGPDIAPNSENEERKSYEDVVLIERLKKSLQKINKNYPDEVIESAIKKLVYADTPDLIINNQKFHKMLTDGIEIEYSSNEGIKTAQVWPIDFTNIENNEFLVVNQYTVIENRKRRPDIIVFINGLPIGIIELKNPRDENATTKGAFNQVQSTYKKDIPSIFIHNEFIVISDGVEAKIGTTTTTWDRFAPWRIIEEKNEPESVPELEIMIKGVFEKSRILDILQNFIVFDIDEKETIKKIAGYHQFRGVNKAIQSTIKSSSKNGDKKIGVIWHSTGSGKSLSMIFYSGKIIQNKKMENPTIVVMTDRNDLDDQLSESFFRTKEIIRQEPQQAKKRTDLRKLLQVSSGGVIFTTVQKFVPEKGETAKLLSDRHNIIVIADEAHRSQYDFIDGFARHVRDSLPNASFIGFTATPIESGDKNTRAVFGDYIDKYDMVQSVEDGFTVGIDYDGRFSKIKFLDDQKQKIDPQFEAITERHEEDERKKLQSKWARLEAIVGSEKNVKQMAVDIVDHFENRIMALKGKGMIVCMSRKMCVKLYHEIIKLKPEWDDLDYKKGEIKIVMTGSASDPPEFQPHLTTKDMRKTIKSRIKNPDDPLKLVIVRDMWLAGFDAPIIHTMYIAKPMHSHTLIQAISRVNRVFEGKPAGLIVDYIAIGYDVMKALIQSSKASKEKISFPIEESVELMLRKYQMVKDFFIDFEYSNFFTGKPSERLKIITGSMAHILEQEEGKKRFTLAVAQLLRANALCGSHEKARELRNEFEFFETIKASFAKNTGSRHVNVQEIDSKIQDLVSRSIETVGVVDLLKASGVSRTPEISILSDEFLQEVKGMKYKNMAIELLSKLLQDEIKIKSQKNASQARSFADMLEKSLVKYENRSLNSATIIDELIKLSKQIRDAQKRGIKLNLSEEELAFYDALEISDTHVKVLGDENLSKIAKELLENLRENASIDWPIRENAKAKLRSIVKRVLTKNGYPDERKDSTTENIMHQAELVSWMV